MNEPSENVGLDFRPTASLENLRRRAELLTALRQFFVARDFLEVTTPLLSRDTIIDRHIEPLRVRLNADPWKPESGPIWFLQTSPEFHMKRLLAAGAEAIFQVTQSFRGGEVGPLHNPEFTIAEWYRVGDDMEAGMRLLAELVEHLTETGPTERISYQAAFQQWADVDPFSDTTDRLRAAMDHHLVQQGSASGSELDRDDILDWLFGTAITPQLGKNGPTIVFDFPENQAALSKIRPGDVKKAERFELFLWGIELANGYHELRSPDELRRRFRHTNAARKLQGKKVLPEDSQLLSAMEHGLPACSGTALGFDRLAMLVLSAKSVEKAMAFGYSNA